MARDGHSGRVMSILEALATSETLTIHIELTPPRTDLSLEQSVDAWIDSNHFIRKVTSQDRFVFMTDGAIGRREEPNLRHVTVNLGAEARRSQIVPILTTKHALSYCLEFAERAYELGYRSLVVLGGDRSDGVPRCVPHAQTLRALIRQRVPSMLLGGWANPNRGASQVEFVAHEDFCADFFLAQIVSHFDLAGLDAFLDEADRRGVKVPGIFGAFYYRSANPRTLEMLSRFLPVPVEALRAALGSGQTPEDVCADTLSAMVSRGIHNVYMSNLPIASASRKLTAIEALLEERLGHVAPEHP